MSNERRALRRVLDASQSKPSVTVTSSQGCSKWLQTMAILSEQKEYAISQQTAGMMNGKLMNEL